MKIILGVDIGTTNVKCYAYDQNTNIVGSSEKKLVIVKSEDNRHEIEPSTLWNSFQDVVNGCLTDSKINVEDVSSLGISTQRGTFVTWDRETGETFHNFITWKDKRSQKLSRRWNSSLTMKCIRFGAYVLYLMTQKTRFKVASTIQLSSSMVLMRLLWILERNQQVQEKVKQFKACFGTIDTWLVWKLTGGRIHATDSSNASCTGFFDPYVMQWSDQILKVFGIPKHILPLVKNTCDSFGEIVSNLFGAPISIHALVGDQQASLFGSRCFNMYDINCTMGTGMFLNMNTGTVPVASYEGVYPLVGWTIGSKTTYIIECGAPDCGTVITWAQNLGFYDIPGQSSLIAQSVDDSGGIYFLPNMDMLNSSVDKNVGLAFSGSIRNHVKAHLVRSILEALAFQVCFVLAKFIKFYEANKSTYIRACGGVSKNNFIIQLISDITKKPVERLKHNESSSLGAALFAGLQCGIWKNLEEISSLVPDNEKFFPNDASAAKSNSAYLSWKKHIYKRR